MEIICPLTILKEWKYQEMHNYIRICHTMHTYMLENEKTEAVKVMI